MRTRGSTYRRPGGARWLKRPLYALLAIVSMIFAMAATIAPAQAVTGLDPVGYAQNVPDSGSCGDNGERWIKFTTGGTTATGLGVAKSGSPDWSGTYTAAAGQFQVLSITDAAGNPVYFSSIIGGASNSNPQWDFPAATSSPLLHVLGKDKDGKIVEEPGNFSQFAICALPVPYMTGSVTKVVDGSTPPAGTSFTVNIDCRMPLKGGGFGPDNLADPKTVTLAAGETLTFKAPDGAQCTFSEPTVPSGYELIGISPNPATMTSGLAVTVTNKLSFVPAPAMEVAKSATVNDVNEDSKTDLGDTITYTVTATNTGNVALTNVTVSDPFTTTVKTCDSVAVGGTCVLTFDYTITSDDVAAGKVVNVATADSDQTPPGTGTTTTPVASNPGMALVKKFTSSTDLDGDGKNELGDTLTYTVTMTNTGDIALTGVTINDSLTGATKDCGTVAVGGTCVLTTTYKITAADVANGTVANTATADSDQTGPTDSKVDVPVTPNPAYTIDKALKSNADEDGNNEVSLGDTLTYTVTVKNTGDIAMDLTVSDSKIDPSSTTCGAVKPGDTCVLTGTYKVTQADVDAGSISNTATAKSNLLDPISDTEKVTVPAHPSIDLAKAGSLNLGADNLATVGDVISYTITVKNTGNVTLDPVTVTDPKITGLTCGATKLAPGASTTCTGTHALTQADIDAAKYDNTASVTGKPPVGDNVTDSDTFTQPIERKPSVDLVKTGSLNLGADSLATPGDVISYTITVKNTGNVTLDPVTVTDPKITGLTCGATKLAPGASTTCTGTHALTQADIDAAKYDNTASVTGTAPGGTKVTDNDTFSQPIAQKPAIDIQKTVDDQIVVKGGTATFTIAVKNIGNVTLTGVTVTDPLSPSCNKTIGTLAPGGTSTYTCTVTNVTAAFKNVATTTGTAPGGKVTDSDDANVWLPTAQIAPTATTCQTFKAGTSADLNAFLYTLKSNKINSVSPGVMFYYSTVTVKAGDTITVTPTDTSATSPTFGVQQGQAYLWSADCSKSTLGTVTASGGTVTLKAPADGTYIIGIKYTPDSTIGLTNPGTVTYSFSTSINGALVFSSQDSILLKQK